MQDEAQVRRCKRCERAQKKRQNTFSKRSVRWILVVALLDLQLSYLLAFLGREQIAETLSITVVTEIVAVMLGYFLKSFAETKEEERLAYHKMRNTAYDVVQDNT